MEKQESEGLTYVTYCGLYCGLCSSRSRIPRQSQALRDTMAKEGYDQWAPGLLPHFKEFWAFLNDHCRADNCCPGCRQGGGNPDCPIRKCAEQQNVSICVDCKAYPCEKISKLGKIYPTLIADGGRLKEIGVERWIVEQKERAQTGSVEKLFKKLNWTCAIA